MNWIENHNRVRQEFTVGKFGINSFLFVDDLVLLSSAKRDLQPAFDWFSAAYNQAGIIISTRKADVLCLFRIPSQGTLHVMGYTLQQM